MVAHLEAPALVERLQRENVQVIALTAAPASIEDADETCAHARAAGARWVVIDGYPFDAAYQQRVRDGGLKVLVLDDIADAPSFSADALLNQNAYATPALYTAKAPGAMMLMGVPFVLLRQEFMEARRLAPTRAEAASRVLVTLGGGDPDNATLLVMQSLACVTDRRLSITIVAGAANPNVPALKEALPALQAVHEAKLIVNATDMPSLMREADVAISAAGSSCWELACLGVPMLLVVVAENQKDIAAELDRRGAAINLGWFHDFDMEAWAAQIRSVLMDADRQSAMSAAGRQMVDGRGGDRVAAFLSGRYSITIATAASGWMRSRLARFEEELRAAGHEVTIVTSVDEMPGGDFLFLLSYWGIVPDAARERYLHTLVVHESDLPEGRGWSPATWAIVEGRNRIPVCLLEASAQVDRGDIYLREAIELSGHELVDEWRDLLLAKTVELCQRFITGFADLVSRREAQSGAGTYLPRRKPDDSRLDPARSIESQFNLLRVVDNASYPAFFEHQGHRYLLKIEKAPS